MKETVVIGGGLGGLLTAAILAKNGQNVTVVEKNHSIGGGLHTFRRGDVGYATGMHVFGGFGEDGIMTKICRYLGIEGRVGVRATDEDCMDEIIMPDERYRLPQGRENYVRYLAEMFPHEAEGIRLYVDALYRLADAELSQLSNMTLSQHLNISTSQHLNDLTTQQMLWPADKLIAYYIKDEKLRAILSYLAPLYSGISGETPAYIHAMVNTLHIDGSYMFEQDSQHFADLLAEIVTDAGGRILTGHTVTGVVVENRKVVSVVVSCGRNATSSSYTIIPEQVICAIDPRQLMEMITPGAFPSSFRERVMDARYCYSAFKLFVKYKEGSMEPVNHPRYFIGFPQLLPYTHTPIHPYTCWNAADVSLDDWPRCTMAVTGERTMTVVAPIAYEWFEQWADSRVGHRPEAYYQFKKELEEKMLSYLSLKNYDASIEDVFSSTPLTIRDYNGICRGSMYGFHKDCNHIMYSKMAVNTKVSNLFMTGQSINLHGMCGVAITSLMTAEAILGNSL